MAYQIAAGDPVIDFDVSEFLRKAATFCKTNAITTEAGLDTFLNAATQTQLNTFVREVLKCVSLTPGP